MISIKIDPQSVTLTNHWGRTKSLAEWLDAMDISEVYSLHGEWAVTNYGLECVTHYYAIEASRLWQGEGYYPWEQHMAQKFWVDLADFCDAIAAAREYHAEIGR